MLAGASQRPFHLPAHQRIEFERQKAGFMRPIFEEAPFAPAESALIERVVAIVSGARENREIMRTHQHIHAVDLQEVHPANGALDARPAGGAVALRIGEALGDKRQSAGLRVG